MKYLNALMTALILYAVFLFIDSKFAAEFKQYLIEN